MIDFKKIYLLLFVVISIFFITGCTNENLNIENKINAEIDFCENRILVFLKNCEYDEYTKDGNLDWESILNSTKDFTNCFPTIEADLSYVKYDNMKIEEIKTILQNINNYAENKDLNKLKVEYGNLYLKMNSIKIDKNKELKNRCMNIYISALTGNKDQCNLEISNFEKEFDNAKKDNNFLETNKFSLNKIQNNILDIKKALELGNFKKIVTHSLKIIEIM